MRGLLLSGGGSYGAFQLGALQHLLKVNPDLDYQFIGGVSVGALAAACLAASPPGTIAHGVEHLAELWKGIKKDRDVYSKTLLPFIRPLLFKSKGCYNTKPLQRLINDNLDIAAIKASGRTLAIGAVDLYTSKYIEAKEDTEELDKWILGSAAHPIAFDPIPVGDLLLTDGGIRNIVPLLQSAIECGCTTVEIIITSPYNKRLEKTLPTNFLETAMRCLEIMVDEIFENDLMSARITATAHNVLVAILYPKTPLVGSPLSFSPSQWRRYIISGTDPGLTILGQRPQSSEIPA